LIKAQKHLPERQRVFSFRNFFLGYSERIFPVSMGEHGLYDVLNVDFVLRTTEEGKMIVLKPRYGTERISQAYLTEFYLNDTATSDVWKVIATNGVLGVEKVSSSWGVLDYYPLKDVAAADTYWKLQVTNGQINLTSNSSAEYKPNPIIPDSDGTIWQLTANNGRLVLTDEITSAPLAVYYYSTQDQYILANDQKLYYLDSNKKPVEIGDIEGTPKFIEFNGRLIICDGGVTKVWDGSTYDKLNDSWEDIVIETGDGTTKNFTGNLSHTPIEPNTLYIYYTSGGVTKIIQDDGKGNLIGDVDAGGTNTINYTTGAYDFTCSSAPDNGTDLTADWQQSEAGPKSQGGVVRGARLYLWGDPDHPSRLYWSDYALSVDSQAHNRWSSTANGGYVDINPRDGSDILGAENFYNVLIVIKGNGIYKVLNYPEDNNFAVVNTFDFGAISKNGIVSTGYGLVVLTKEGLVHLFSTEKFGDIDRALLTDDIDLTNLINANSYLGYNPISGQVWFTGYDSNDGSYRQYCHVVDMETKLLTKYQFKFIHTCYQSKLDKMLIGGKNGHLYELKREYLFDDQDKFDILIQSGFTNWGMPLNRFHNKRYSVELYSNKGFSFDFYLYKDGHFTTPVSIDTGLGDETVYDADEEVEDATIQLQARRISKWKVFNYDRVMFKITNFDGLGTWELHRVDLISAILGA